MKQLLIGLLLLNSAVAHAESDPKQTLKTQLSTLTSYSASFTQVVTDMEGEMLQQTTGKLRLQQPSQLYWQVDEPNENTLIADGQTLWHIDPFVEQVVAMPQAQAVENNPIVLLTNPSDSTWDKFTVTQTEGTFVIAADSEQGQIAQLILSFDDGRLTGLKMLDRQSQTSDFSFANIQQNGKIAQSLFQFVLPDGFDLDDQRPQ